MCDMNCLECVHGDCINNSPATLQERNLSKELDNDCKEVVVVEDNKDTIKAKQRAYREANREEINRKKREAYHRKKKERSEASVS